MDQLQHRMTLDDGTIYSLYEDPAYPIRPQLIAPFRCAFLTAHERLFNQRMSEVRVAVEWSFAKTVTNFAFLDYKKNLELYLQPVVKYYAVGTILTNFHTCLYGSEIGDKFYVEAPSLHNYLRG